jgi:hypothetical protein
MCASKCVQKEAKMFDSVLRNQVRCCDFKSSFLVSSDALQIEAHSKHALILGAATKHPTVSRQEPQDNRSESVSPEFSVAVNSSLGTGTALLAYTQQDSQSELHSEKLATSITLWRLTQSPDERSMI